MKVRLVSVLIGILGLSFNAHADFVHITSPVFGVGSITYNSNQNLNWLTPNATIGMSYNQVNDMLATDLRFTGFRYATVTELANLYLDFGIPDINIYGDSSFGTQANALGANTLQVFLGVTSSIHSFYEGLIRETAGLVGSPFVSTINSLTQIHVADIVTQNVIFISSNGVAVPFGYASTTQLNASLGVQYEGIGSFLVSSVPVSNVPVPSAWALMIAGLFFCWLFSAQKGSHPHLMMRLTSTGALRQYRLAL